MDQILDPLAWPGREVMLLAEGSHGIDGLAPALLFLLAQDRIFRGDGFQSAFHDFCCRS